MPVYKYKSFEEAEKALWNNKVDRYYLDDLKEFYKLNEFLKANVNFTKGIRKFFSFEEADRAKTEEILSKKNN